MAIRLRMMMRFPVGVAVFAACLMSACVPASAPPAPNGGQVTPAPRPVQPAPQAAPAPQPVPAAGVWQTDWTYWPVTPGDWVYRQDERGSIALFGPLGQNALVSLRCDRAQGAIFLSRQGQASGSTTITLRASQGLESFPAAQAGDSPYIAAAIAPSNPMLDKLAYSRGRFVVESPGFPPLKLPNWAEVARVIEDCRG